MDVVECSRCGRSRPVAGGTALGASCPYCLLIFAFGDDDDLDEEAAGASPKLPERIGPYRLHEPLGTGGMGSVYRAEHEALGRVVALKLLKPEFAARAGFRERFLREGRTLASLTHPNIVGIHDTGCDGGLYYLAMEYVAGSTLRERLNAGGLSIDEALARFYELCDALSYAHERGIVHRDIKPENVLLDADGRAKLADFGVAKLLAGDEAARGPATEVDAVVGTRRYMAPEQLEFGRPIDARTDLYALAAVLYEMLEGEAPLGVFAPPSAKLPAAAPLDEPILAALAKDPTSRPADAREFRRRIEEAWRNRGRLRSRRWVIGGAAVAVAAAAALVLPALRPARQPIESAPRRRRLPHPANVWRAVFSPNGATLATACGNHQLRFWPPVGYEPIASFEAFPRGELGYLALAFSPEGTSFVTAGGENVARVWDAQSYAERFTLKGHTREIVDAAWSPDGTLIATVGHDKSVRLWNAADSTKAASFEALPDPTLCVAFSPDGALVVAGLMNGAIKAWDIATREPRGNFGHQKRVRALAFVPNGDGTFVSGSHDGSVKIWHPSKKGMLRELAAEGEVWSLAVSPRGDLLVAGLNDGTLRLWSFPDGKPRTTPKYHTGSIVGVSFSKDGAKLATASLDQSVYVWDVDRLE